MFPILLPPPSLSQLILVVTVALTKKLIEFFCWKPKNKKHIQNSILIWESNETKRMEERMNMSEESVRQWKRRGREKVRARREPFLTLRTNTRLICSFYASKHVLFFGFLLKQLENKFHFAYNINFIHTHTQECNAVFLHSFVHMQSRVGFP